MIYQRAIEAADAEGRLPMPPVADWDNPRALHDLGDLPMDPLIDFGPLAQRIERAITDLGEVGRVHVCRWSDGSAHLQVWFMGRPARLPQTVGGFAMIWDDILPPVPEQVWRETLTELGPRLAADGGESHA